MTHGTRCIYRYDPALHASDGRDLARLQAQDGLTVTVVRDHGLWVLVHTARGLKMYAHCNELQPIATNQTPAGVQGRLFE